jgi:CheY-like chemotaxis protein/HPt (histidine-containing phosphotransfer) domain-containing protein
LKQESATRDFNLILIDYLLSDTDGFTLAADIKAMDNLAHIPLVLTTSVGNIGDGRRCEDIGINGYLSGPLDPVLLKKAIRLVMGSDGLHSSSEKPCLVTRHYIAETLKDEGRILLVEDYPTNRQVAVNFISMAGFEVDVAENGKEAVDKFLEGSYALIFMDIQMPVMDGYEATRAIRQLESEGKGIKGGERTPIVAMTANALTRDRENSLEAGMDDFITKPVTRASLLTVISTWLPGYSDSSLLTIPTESSQNKQTTPQNPETPLDYDQALSEFMGDKDVLVNTLNYFLNHCREQVGIIASALSENNSEVVRAEAHKIKGGSANLTMQVLSSAAAELELSGKSGNLDEADGHLTRITLELDSLERFLSQL